MFLILPQYAFWKLILYYYYEILLKFFVLQLSLFSFFFQTDISPHGDVEDWLVLLLLPPLLLLLPMTKGLLAPPARRAA